MRKKLIWIIIPLCLLLFPGSLLLFPSGREMETSAAAQTGSQAEDSMPGTAPEEEPAGPKTAESENSRSPEESENASSDSVGPSSGQESAEPPEMPESHENPAFEEHDITLMALGDNLLHMGIVKTGRREDGSYDYSFLFESIKDYLYLADIKIINQETIFGGNDLGFSGYPRFNSPTEVGDAIAAAGFNVVLHATNHAADQGIDGIYNCLSFWESYPEILVTGIHGENEIPEIPLLTIGDVTFAVLNYTYSPNSSVISSKIRGHLDMLCAYDEKSGAIDMTSLNPKVTEDIQRASELADIVIVCPHWGTEYRDKPSSRQRRFAEEMTAAGADLIIGTHPHVPQPVEWITAENGNTALCFYSLGNYVSTQKKALCMLEGMAWVTFRVTEDGVSISGESSGVLPLVCHYKKNRRLGNIYLLEDYSEELALKHGIWDYGGVPLHYEDLQSWSQKIFGEWVLERSDILGDAEDF